MSARAARYSSAVDHMRAAHASATVTLEPAPKPVLVPSIPRKAPDPFGDTFTQVHWGIAEKLRLAGYLLVLSAYAAVLWFAGSTLLAVWH